MIISKRRHALEVATLSSHLAEREARIADLENRLVKAEAELQTHTEKRQQLLRKISLYQSAGEAAFAYANDYGSSAETWANADQDLWEEAACGAILFGQQYAAAAQIAYFKQGACVPYYIERENGVEKVFTAHLSDLGGGRITISVDGQELRQLEALNTEHAIEFFSDLVTSPPGFIPS